MGGYYTAFKQNHGINNIYFVHVQEGVLSLNQSSSFRYVGHVEIRTCSVYLEMGQWGFLSHVVQYMLGNCCYKIVPYGPLVLHHYVSSCSYNKGQYSTSKSIA